MILFLLVLERLQDPLNSKWLVHMTRFQVGARHITTKALFNCVCNSSLNEK
jgi:hypothetical protein